MSLRDAYGINAGDPNNPGLLESVVGPPEWTTSAACASVDPELFFPEKGGSTREAKTICNGRDATEKVPARPPCPVREECLAWALEIGERFGIYGGTSERARRQLILHHEQPLQEPA